MSKFTEQDCGKRVRLHSPPEDKLMDETGVLLGPYPYNEFQVVVRSDRKLRESDDGLRICDEDYVDLSEE